jgi:hypothetical protein
VTTRRSLSKEGRTVKETVDVDRVTGVPELSVSFAQ